MMNGGGRGVINGLRDRDEDLFLFKELQKREKERSVCLLQPVSDDFEANPGSLSFYRMSSGKKSSGFEFLRETDKNDYDWLKTPPATPLFQSLDMETNAPDLIVQRELPISRFSGNSETINVERPKPLTNQNATQSPLQNTRQYNVGQLRPKTPQVNQTVTQSRPATGEAKNKVMKQNHDHKKRPTTAEAKSTTRSHLATDQTKRVHTSQRSKNMTVTEPRNRGVSPQVRRSIPQHQILVLSDETPPNLRTDRSLSATRGRPVITPTITTKSSDRSTSATRIRPAASTATPKAMMRQSCSPRGRKVEDQVIGIQTRSSGVGGQVFGSKMVDRLMNARKSSVTEHEKKEIRTVKGGFGRFMPKSSIDMLSNIRT